MAIWSYYKIWIHIPFLLLPPNEEKSMLYKYISLVANYIDIKPIYIDIKPIFPSGSQSYQ